MAATIVVACRQALVTLLQAREGLAGVQVTYGWPGTDKVERERMYTARASGEHADAALKAGRRYRRETAQFDVVIETAALNGTPEDAESRALVLGTEVEECVADEKYLAGVTGLIVARVSGFTLDSGSNEYGSIAQLIYTVKYEARLT